MLLNGQRLALRSYSSALARGINLVSQEIQVIPKSTVAENIMLDKLDRYFSGGHLQWAQINADAERFTRMVGLEIAPTALVGGLSAAQKQLIMIARALSADVRILVLDEPTSALTRHETQNLLGLLRKIVDGGVTILFVTHKLEEVLQVADMVTVLRDGKHIGTVPTRELAKVDIVRMMIGREALTTSLGELHVDRENVALEASYVTQYGRFNDVNFSLYKGEILGFYGLVGSGRTELAEILIGEDRKDKGEVLINGQPTAIHSMADSLYTYRMGYVSENRKEKGLILSETIKANTTSPCGIAWSIAGVLFASTKNRGRRSTLWSRWRSARRALTSR